MFLIKSIIILGRFTTMKIFEIIFSPTGGTQKCADIFAAAFGKEVELVDLTDYAYDFTSTNITKEDICIIAAPAYGGRIPETAASRLKLINGNGAKAVLIAVYGNREFDDCLVELQDLVTENGFIPVAGVGAVAEHSLIRKFGAGRPDVSDIEELNLFADKIIKKLEENSDSSITLPGNRPYKVFPGSSVRPLTSDACVKCMLCAWQCPVEAISEKTPNSTNTEKCISCMRCISICPNQARYLATEVIEAFTQRLSSVASDRKQNSLYL